MSGLPKTALRVLIAVLIILVGGWILYFVANTAAFLSSPRMIAKFQCPAGSTIKQTQQEPYPGAGYQNTTIRCIDQNGNTVPPLPGDERPPSRFRFYYPPVLLLVTLFVVGWLAWSACKKKSRRE